jgi:hypothetical protein
VSLSFAHTPTPNLLARGEIHNRLVSNHFTLLCNFLCTHLLIVYEKPSGQYLDFICDESLTCRFELSYRVQVAGATRQAAKRIVVRVGDLVQRTGDDQAQVGYLVAK